MLWHLKALTYRDPIALSNNIDDILVYKQHTNEKLHHSLYALEYILIIPHHPENICTVPPDRENLPP